MSTQIYVTCARLRSRGQDLAVLRALIPNQAKSTHTTPPGQADQPQKPLSTTKPTPFPAGTVLRTAARSIRPRPAAGSRHLTTTPSTSTTAPQPKQLNRPTSPPTNTGPKPPTDQAEAHITTITSRTWRTAPAPWTTPGAQGILWGTRNIKIRCPSYRAM